MFLEALWTSLSKLKTLLFLFLMYCLAMFILYLFSEDFTSFQMTIHEPRETTTFYLLSLFCVMKTMKSLGFIRAYIFKDMHSLHPK